MKFVQKKRVLSFLIVVIFLLSIISSIFVFNAFAIDNNNWEAAGTSENITLTTSGSTTNIAFGAEYDYSKSLAQLPNKLAPVADKTFAFKFKATDLTGGWIPIVLCWSANVQGSLMTNGLFCNVTNGNLEFRNCADVAAASNSTAIANVAINTTQSHVVSVKLIDETTSTISVSVDGTEAVQYVSVSMASQLKFAFTDSLQGLTLCVGGAANTAITFDTNASLWNIVGNANQLNITGDTNIANLNFNSGDFSTVYAQFPNKLSQFSHGSFGYSFNLKSLSSWAVLMNCWTVTNGSPVTSNSGVFFIFEPDGSSGYQFSVKKLVSDTNPAIAPVPITLNTNYKMIMECDASNNISVYLNGVKIGTYKDNNISSALLIDFPYAGLAGLTVATAGSGAYIMSVDTSPVTRSKTELNSLITDCTTLGNATTANVGTPEYGQVTSTQKTDFMGAISTAQSVYADELATPLTITAAYNTLKSAKILFTSQIVATPDKSILQATYNESKILYDSTAVGSTYGKVPQEAKDIFQTALTSAKATLDSKTADQTAVDGKNTTLKTAKSAFSAATLKAGDPALLLTMISAAQEVLPKLTVGSNSHTQLTLLIAEAQTAANDVGTLQSVLDSKEEALNQLLTTINSGSNFWSIAPVSGTTTISGITATADNFITTITSEQGAPSWADAINSTQVVQTNKIIFNVNEMTHAANDWSCVSISNGITGDILHTKSFRIIFGGSGGNGEIDQFVTLSDIANKQIGSFAYALNSNVQFKFELITVSGVDTVIISVDGMELVQTTDADYVNIMKHDLTIAYTSGNINGNAKTIIDLKPSKVFGYSIGDFAPTGMAGTGNSSEMLVIKDGERQDIIFYENCTYTEGIAKTIITGPVVEFSLKIAEQGQTDWHAILLSNGIETHAANTSGLTIAFGGDLSVTVKQYGQSGMGGIALWESTDGGFAQIGKKMRFKIYEDETTGNLIVIMNDKIIANQASPDIIALLKSEKITMTLFGSADAQSKYEISYLNKADPVTFDSFDTADELLAAPEVISLNDSIVAISDSKVISIYQEITIDELKTYLNVANAYHFVFFDANGTAITDLSQSASIVNKIGVYLEDNQVDLFTIAGSSNNPRTGTDYPLKTCMIIILLTGSTLIIIKKRVKLRIK